MGFTGAASVLNILNILIRSKFDIRALFNPNTLIYEIGLEGMLLIGCGALTYFVAKHFKNFTLQKVSISAFIFAATYMILSSLVMLLMWQYFDVFKSFFAYFSSGIRDGILFMLMWILFKQGNINEPKVLN
jgi:cell shape-determining protein MreD